MPSVHNKLKAESSTTLEKGGNHDQNKAAAAINATEETKPKNAQPESMAMIFESKLHSDYGRSKELFGGGQKKWDKLIKVEWSEEDQILQVDFAAEILSTEENAKLIALYDVANVMKVAFSLPEINEVMVRGHADFVDLYGNKSKKWWILGGIKAVEGRKVQWDNLSNEGVEKLLHAKGFLTIKQ